MIYRPYIFVFLASQSVTALTTDNVDQNGADSLAERACTVPANWIKNPGFESGNLAPWLFSSTYTTPANTATVVNVGQNSGHSEEQYGIAYPGDTGNIGKLAQTFNICKNVTHTLTLSAFQVKGQTNFDSALNSRPYLAIEVIAPQTGYNYELVRFDLDKTSFNSSINSAAEVVNPQGVWRTFKADFPFARTGNWTLQSRLFVFALSGAKSPTKGRIRVDNVIVKPK